MINCYNNNWLYNIGLIISIDNGSWNELPTQNGFTHLAEHLMFSGTEKFSAFELSNIHSEIFSNLEATTSRQRIKIFCHFDLNDFDTAVDVLHQMIFHWKCDESDFPYEKEEILEEIDSYTSSCENKAFKEMISLLPLKNYQEPLGDLNAIKELSYWDIVKKVKPYWNSLLNNSRIRITVVSGKLSSDKLSILDERFTAKSSSSPSKKEAWSVYGQNIINNDKCSVFLYKSSRPHINEIILDRIFQFRAWKEDPELECNYTRQGNISAYYIYSNKKLDLSVCNSIFTKEISEAEFSKEKNIFLSYFRGLLDTVDIVDSLKWFEEFDFINYEPVNESDPEKIYQYLEKLNFDEFRFFMKSIQNF